MGPRPQNETKGTRGVLHGIKKASGAPDRKVNRPESETPRQDFLVEFPQGRYCPQTSPVSESGMYNLVLETRFVLQKVLFVHHFIIKIDRFF